MFHRDAAAISAATAAAATSREVLILFAGSYSRLDSLQAFLQELDLNSTVVDNGPEGNPLHNWLDDSFYDALTQRVLRGDFFAIFAAPPCSTFSVSRFYDAKRSKRGDRGPPPVRKRACPAGLPSPPPQHAAELAAANEIVDKLCKLLLAASSVGAEYVVENPSDRGDRNDPSMFLFADHAPLWLYPNVIDLQQRTNGRMSTFAQCQFGAPYQKYTTFLYSPGMAPTLAGLDNLRCTHSSHSQPVGGSTNQRGVWVSQRSAAYPTALNQYIAHSLHAVRLRNAPPPPQPTQRQPLPAVHLFGGDSTDEEVLLLPISVGRRLLVCVPAGGGVYSTTATGRNGAARKSATAAATAAIPAVTNGVHAEAVFLAGMLDGRLIVVGACGGAQQQIDVCTSRAQVLARSVEHGPQTPVWCSLDTVAEGIGTDSDATSNAQREHTYHAAAAAVARTLSHAGPDAAALAPALAIGAPVGGTVGRNAAETASPADFDARYARAIAADTALREELTRSADECGDAMLAATYLNWADRITPPPLDDIPDGLRRQSLDFASCSHLATLPFAQRCSVPATSALPPPVAQPACAGNWRPTCLSDVLKPTAVSRIRAALLKIQEWHALRRSGIDAPRPPPLALGIDAFMPRARGRIWDLRACKADGSGVPTLLDTAAAPFTSHLNVPFIETLFAGIADQELLSMMRFGVCTHAELPAQIVIFPNLLSLYDGDSGINEAARAVSELTQFGWWQQHDFIPFAPWRCAPRGAVPRKDGGVARGIVDQGAPRTELFTRPAFEPVTSLNDACRAGRERAEVKPRFGDLAKNASILLHAGELIGEPVYTIAFDFAKFFHQLWFRSDELWRMGSLLPLADSSGAADELLSIHTEMVMSMGLTPSSEIAQRLANALMQVFSERLIAAEEAQGWARSDAEMQWRARRASLPTDMLGPASRLHDAMCYTDDPCWVVVGTKRTALAVRVWHEIIIGTGLMPAKHPKWQIGAGVRWLGGCCYPSLGIMWIPQDKALRVCERIQTVLDGTCTPKTYQEIIGFLEHVVDIGKFPREMMQYLHDPMRAGGECETDPHGTLPTDGRRDGYLRKWRSVLLNSPGSSLLAACEQRELDTEASVVWRLRSDAMLEPNESAMGGCLYGAWWRLPLRRPQMTIPVLEMLAACVNFIIFAGELAGARQVVMEIDALASPLCLHSDKARSPGLRAVLAEFRRLPQLKPFVQEQRLFCAHCWGEGNPLGDAASRDKRAVLRELGSALGLHMRQVHVGSEALAFIDRVLRRLDAMPLTHAEREFDSTLGFPGEGHGDSPPPSTIAAASPSPVLISFLEHSERSSNAAAASPDPAAVSRRVHSHSANASPPPPLAFHSAAASPSRPHSPSPPPSPPPPPPASPTHESFYNSPSTFAATHLPCLHAIAAPWCTSTLPEPDVAASAEELHRAVAATQCSHIKAEAAVSSLAARILHPHAAPPAAASSSAGLPPARRSSTATAGCSSSFTTISEVALARARHLTEALRSEAADGGLRMNDDEADHLSTRLVQLLEGAAASNTLKGERSNWRHWMAFCVARNTNPFRTDVRGMNHVEYDKEVVTLALALLYIYGRMSCRPGRKHPPRPASALAVLRGIRRAHDRIGVRMADLSLAARLADALNKEYIDEHGWEALQVDRVAPLTNEIIKGMIGAEAIAGDDLASTSYRALWATLAQTGFRKAEVSMGSAAAFGPSCLTRHNLRWRIDKVEYADPSPALLGSMRDGDLAILVPPKSKCDQYGLEWGQAPIYLRYHSSAPICAARALRDLELRMPLRGLSMREGHLLFVRSDGSPLLAADVDKMFKECLRTSGVPRNAAARYSPHSFRRYLACALRAQKAPDATIQALLRWKTAESLKLYSILNDESYADLIDGAGAADVSSMRTNALPRAQDALPRTELLDAAGDFHTTRHKLHAAAKRAERTEPGEDDAERSDLSDSDSDSSAADEPAASAAPAPAVRRRGRPAATPAAAPSRTARLAAAPSAAPASTARTRGRLAAAPAAPADTLSGIARPRKGARVEVYWTEERQWFAGTVGATRRTDGATRILYDAYGVWPAHSYFHVLAIEYWRHSGLLQEDIVATQAR